MKKIPIYIAVLFFCCFLNVNAQGLKDSVYITYTDTNLHAYLIDPEIKRMTKEQFSNLDSLCFNHKSYIITSFLVYKIEGDKPVQHQLVKGNAIPSFVKKWVVESDSCRLGFDAILFSAKEGHTKDLHTKVYGKEFFVDIK